MNIGEPSIEKKPQTDKSKEALNKIGGKIPIGNKILTAVFGVLGAIFGYLVVRYLGILFAGMFAVVIAASLYFSRWYYSKHKMETKLTKFILWSNILTWLLPPLGMFTSVLTYKMGIFYG